MLGRLSSGKGEGKLVSHHFISPPELKSSPSIFEARTLVARVV